MSDSYTIHVRPKGDAQVSEFLCDAEAALRGSFSPDVASGGLISWTSTNIVYAFIENVTFDDDENVPFSRYPWYLDETPDSTESAEQATIDHMQSIYQALVDTGRYGCCLVYAFSELLANNDGLTSRS